MSLHKKLNTNQNFPVIGSPMFLVSGPELVIEQCRNGVVGCFPSLNQRTTEGFEEWVIQIKNALKQDKANGGNPAAYGVNLIVHGTNTRLKADLEVCMKHQVPLIITSLGAVKDVVDAVHSYGGLVFHDVIKKRHAEKAAGAGVDGLIGVCAGAGGHAGMASPFAFVKELKQVFDGAIILAGSISTGSDVLAAKAMGADFSYMGTRFINTQESRAATDYKNMIIDSGISDVVYTDKVSGVWANFLQHSLPKISPETAEKPEEDFSKLNDEAKAWKDIWSAGHGVAAIQDIPTVKDLVLKLKEEYATAKSSL